MRLERSGMAAERYPGERRTLRVFLSELEPVVAREFGRDALLVHAVRRALRSDSLDDMRHARCIFNALPRSARKILSDALVEQAALRGGRLARPIGDARARPPRALAPLADQGPSIRLLRDLGPRPS
jgi:hypothetical protein